MEAIVDTWKEKLTTNVVANEVTWSEIMPLPLLIRTTRNTNETTGQGQENERGGTPAATPSSGAGPPPKPYDQLLAEGHAWAYEQAMRTWERKQLVARIDTWLAHRGSPCAGLGYVFVDAEERTGVSATLMVGVADVESTCFTNGSLSRTHHNGFGMKGPHAGQTAVNGWCWWPDWESGINGAFDFVLRTWGPVQSAYEMRGYCVPNHPWMPNVERVKDGI